MGALEKGIIGNKKRISYLSGPNTELKITAGPWLFSMLNCQMLWIIMHSIAVVLRGYLLQHNS